MLTDLQRVVLAQLRRRHLTLIAEQAEQCWTRGQRAYFDARARCPGWLRQLSHEANDETIKASPKLVKISARELFAGRPRQRRAAPDPPLRTLKIEADGDVWKCLTKPKIRHFRF